MWIFTGLFGLASVLVTLYAAIIFRYRQWFNKLRPVPLEKTRNNTRFSVIIPARNEQDNITGCIESIMENGYPENCLEIIVIDDHSSDDTSLLVKELQQKHANLKLISLSEKVPGKLNSYKKKAIEIAIEEARHEWIVTTDADCFVHPEWLWSINGFINSKPVCFVAAPVKYKDEDTFVSIFQSLDFISLQGITAASVSAGFHSMCNGANIAYRKDVFLEVGGFKGVDKIASGDDMLLMGKIMKKYPRQVGYLFNQHAIVSTAPMKSWRDFFNQRIRWASKATYYKDNRIFLVLLLVYMLNLILLLLPIGFFWAGWLWKGWLLALALKSISEFLFLMPVATFFGEKKLMKWFFLMQPVHIIYIVVAGWLGRFGSYHWKGRKVN